MNFAKASIVVLTGVTGALIWNYVGVRTSEPGQPSTPAETNKVRPAEPRDALSPLDARIDKAALGPTKPSALGRLKRRLTPDRLRQSEDLRIWAARAGLRVEGCATVTNVSINPDSSNRGLAWHITCDRSLGFTVTEHDILQLMAALSLDPVQLGLDRLSTAISNYALVRQASGMSAGGDGVGLLINLKGELCAHSYQAVPADSPDTFTVRCQERRDGDAEVRYLLNAKSGDVRRL